MKTPVLWWALLAFVEPFMASGQVPCQGGTQIGTVTYTSGQTVSAQNYILANGVVTVGEGVGVVFKAGQDICFEPGFSFSAPAGGSLIATIGAPPAPSVYGPSSLPYGIQGQPYGPVTLTGSGGTGNYSWSTTGFPAGITISPAGIIAGTPASGSSAFYSPVATVTDTLTGLTGSRTWANVAMLSVSPISLSVGPSSLSTAIVIGAPAGIAWSAVSTNTNWLSVSSGASGIGSGTIALNIAANSAPSARTAYITLSLAGGIAGSYVVQQAGSPITITSVSPLLTGIVGSSYSQSMSATGGSPPYSWSATGLPTGLSISTSGVISGTPSASSNGIQVGLSVKDSASNQVSGTVLLTVGITGCSNQPLINACSQ